LHQPKVLLLDEPTVGVDPQSRNHLFERIESLKTQGVTIIYTTHYMEEAARLCDRVAIMDKGQLLAIDTVPGLISAHGGESVVEASCDSALPDRWARFASSDGTIRLQAREPLAEVAQMSADGLRFRTLQVTQPSLEQVFLNLTGRSLRDE
jgi:ABC-2 type transport system ATP-binding protein